MRTFILIFGLAFAFQARAQQYCWAKCIYHVPAIQGLQSRQMVMLLTVKEDTFERMRASCSEGKLDSRLVKIENDKEDATPENICNYTKEDLDRILR